MRSPGSPRDPTRMWCSVCLAILPKKPFITSGTAAMGRCGRYPGPAGMPVESGLGLPRPVHKVVAGHEPQGVPLGAVASRGPQVRPRMRGSTHWPGMLGESIGGWATMGVAPGPHHVSGIWTMPLTMRMVPRSSESWSKIPTAVPSRPATPRPAPLTGLPRSLASPTLMRRRSRARAPLATLVRAHLRAGRWGCRSCEGSVRKPFDDILGVPLEARFPISVAHA